MFGILAGIFILGEDLSRSPVEAEGIPFSIGFASMEKTAIG